MNLFKRIISILWAIASIIVAYFMIEEPDIGYIFVLIFLSLRLIIAGIKYLIYYFSMAKNMVGGKSILYKGVIILNFGFFTLTLFNLPHTFILLYLLGSCLFLGFISIMRAREMKKQDSPWQLKFSTGIIYILLAIIGFACISSANIAVYIYCIGLILGSIDRIISLFKKTAIVYVP